MRKASGILQRLVGTKHSIWPVPPRHSAYLLTLALVLIPHAALAQSNAEWTQYKIKCGIPASTAYNDWVAQGSPCPKTASGASSTAPAVPSLNPQQQLAMQGAAVAGYMIGQGLHEMLFGKPTPPVDPAKQQQQLAAQQLNNSGLYLLRQKNYAGAINEFQKALAIIPNDASILQNLALAKRQFEQSRKDGAAATQTSGALSNLLDTSSAGPLSSSAGTVGSALNSIDLNSATNVVDLRDASGTVVDPAMLKYRSDVKGNGQPISQQDLDAQFDKAINASEAPPQVDRKQLDAQFDQAIKGIESEPQTARQPLHAKIDKAQVESAPPATAAEPVTAQTAAAAPASPQQVAEVAQTTARNSAANGNAAGVPAQPVQSEAAPVSSPKPANSNQNLAQSLDEALSPGTVDFDGRGPGNVPISAHNAPGSGSPQVPSRPNQTVSAPQWQAGPSGAVDTRNVPSGLPKSLDDAIATAYPAALPGVSDRVRKGFQAVEKHDWVTAQAYFKDALNHDPGNASLEHLVELAGEGATSSPSADGPNTIWQQLMQLVAPPPRKPKLPTSVGAVRD